MQSVDVSQCCSEVSEPYANDYEPENAIRLIDEEGYFSLMNSELDAAEEAEEQEKEQESSQSQCSVLTEDLERQREEEIQKQEEIEQARLEKERKNIPETEQTLPREVCVMQGEQPLGNVDVSLCQEQTYSCIP